MPRSGDADAMARPSPSVMQHAVRLLVLLDGCSEPTAQGDPDSCVAVIRAEMRLQALDFWLRNPDYLAGELLEKVQAGDLSADTYIPLIEALLESPEPDLHWYPMPRWHHGAYEAIDDAFSILSAYGLALVGRKGGIRKTARSQFFLTEAGREAVDKLRTDKVLSWYTKQVKLVALVAGSDLGSRLKQRQYKQAEYAHTKLGTYIAPIHAGVRERLNAEKDAAGRSNNAEGAS
ncbi:hypothetical protein [Brevibacterium aurantiacum]|uniref:hypothetical protein n=1 Tax=Brevibacterium aurantiacum TaxID=273384 RepID=UPI000F6352AA|nr:hypothetical protein [Brevibacterium aurantiacum]AZL04632.1 hypothetical protein CXR24_02705 [Brevibacterium aurantiacum]